MGQFLKQTPSILTGITGYPSYSSLASPGNIINNVIVPPNGSFTHAVLQGNYRLVKYMLHSEILTEEWDIHLALEANDTIMLDMLLDHGVEPDDDDVDKCILEHDMDTAIKFTENYDCLPTEDAFEMLFHKMDKGMDTDDYIRVLEWLHYQKGVEMDDSTLSAIRGMQHMDPLVIKWFSERV